MIPNGRWRSSIRKLKFKEGSWTQFYHSSFFTDIGCLELGQHFAFRQNKIPEWTSMRICHNFSVGLVGLNRVDFKLILSKKKKHTVPQIVQESRRGMWYKQLVSLWTKPLKREYNIGKKRRQFKQMGGGSSGSSLIRQEALLYLVCQP